MAVRALISLAAISAALAAAPAAAQFVTNITPDVAPGLATGTTTAQAGNVTTIAGGVRAGANLFHSFRSFSLGAGDVAQWTATDPTSIANVISRVTGRATSFIAGKLDSTSIPRAAFWFINPAGIVFGDNAQVSVPGAAYFGSANSINFGDGPSFSATTPDGSTFNISNPTAFGFLGQEGSLAVGSVKAGFIGKSNSLVLAGSNVSIDSASFNVGSLALLAVGSEGSSNLPVDGSAVQSSASGQLTITRSNISVDRLQQDGSLLLVAGELNVLAGSLFSVASDSGTAGNVIIRAEDATIKGFLGSRTGLAGDAGTVSFSGQSLAVRDGGSLQSSTSGVGDAGNVSVSASGSVTIGAGGEIAARSTPTATTGGAGSVSIEAGSLTLEDDAAGSVRPPQISSSTQSQGNGGSIDINVHGPMSVGHGAFVTTNAGSQSRNADAGTLQIKAGSLDVVGGQIRSTTASNGPAGNVAIQVEGPVLLDAGTITTASFGATGGAGGEVSLAADSLSMNHASQITSTTASRSAAGAVDITTSADAGVGQGSIISSATTGEGSAGSVRLTAKNINLSGASKITSTTSGSGSAGVVELAAAENLTINAASVSASSSTSTSGAAGSVIITAGTLDILRGGQIASTTVSSSPAGMVQINVGGAATLAGEAIITSSTSGAGAAGSVSVSAGTVDVRDGATIRSVTDAIGNAGDVSVSASGGITIGAGGEIAARSTPTATTGGAGSVSIEAGSLALEDDAAGSVRPPQISSSTQSQGNGGSIDINVHGPMSVGHGAFVTTNAGSQSRNADAGTLQIKAGSLDVAGGQIRSTTASNGRAGNVAIQVADALLLNDGGSITTSSATVSSAGAIEVASGSIQLDGVNSRISSANTSSAGGPAGSILLSGTPIRLSNGGSVSTDSRAGPAGDITLTLPRDGFLFLTGAAHPSVITTSSGPGTGGRITISDPYAIISNGGEILALGQQGGANVQIHSSFFIRSADRLNLLSVAGSLVLDSQVDNVANGALSTDISYIDASGVLRGQCPAPSGGSGGSGVSQFNSRGAGPYGTEDAPADDSPGTAATPVAMLPAVGGCR